VTSTANAFNFRGLLQNHGFFSATFQIKCSGTADAIYFYFGGSSAPIKESDTASGAFIVGLSVYHNWFQAFMDSSSVNINQPYIPILGSWISVNIQYIRISNTSFTVSVIAGGSPVLASTVVNANTWLSSQSRDYWGIGARTGDSSGTFSFTTLEVKAGDDHFIHCLNPLQHLCYPQNFSHVVEYLSRFKRAKLCFASRPFNKNTEHLHNSMALRNIITTLSSRLFKSP
jgi:hypothetical protein